MDDDGAVAAVPFDDGAALLSTPTAPTPAPLLFEEEEEDGIWVGTLPPSDPPTPLLLLLLLLLLGLGDGAILGFAVDKDMSILSPIELKVEG